MQFENYGIVEELSLCKPAQDGVAKCLGSMREGDQVTWIFLEHCGKTLTQAAQGNPSLLSQIICQVGPLQCKADSAFSKCFPGIQACQRQMMSLVVAGPLFLISSRLHPLA